MAGRPGKVQDGGPGGTGWKDGQTCSWDGRAESLGEHSECRRACAFPGSTQPSAHWKENREGRHRVNSRVCWAVCAGGVEFYIFLRSVLQSQITGLNAELLNRVFGKMQAH